jgi:hypothetical protein
MTHYPGLPLHGSPLVVILPQILRRTNLNHPHPFGKGRGGCSGSRLSRVVVVFRFEPTSLKRGEGLASGLPRMLWTKCGGQGEGGGSGMGGGRTNINRDGVDVGFKLRLPSKIALDIGVH